MKSRIYSVLNILVILTSQVVSAQEEPVPANEQQPLAPLSSDFQAADEVSSTEVIDLAPESVELVVALDPKGYGLRARNYSLLFGIDADPVFRGRLTANLHLKYFDFMTLFFPVSFESSQMSILHQYQGNPLGLSDYVSILGGAGLKFRVTELFMKSNMFIEVSGQIGYVKQTRAQSNNTTRIGEAIRIRPNISFGWERIFDSGFVVTAKAGVEYAFDISLNAQPLEFNNGFEFVPGLGIGYAW